MQTKINEIIKEVSDISEMSGMFLSNTLLRKWNEDFVDEDTGETASIEKSEVILEKGTLLDSDAISQINFFLQSKEISSVSISNQQRECHLVKSTPSVWVSKIKLNGKPKNIYLYADSLMSATNICIDYVEQKFSGNFKIISLKELDYSTLISLEHEHETDDKVIYYQTEVEVTYHNEEPEKQTFIINASNAEKAKSKIIDYISILNSQKNNTDTFTVTIISAKTISCDNIVEKDFSLKYLTE